VNELLAASVKLQIREYRELHRFYYRRKMELMKQLKEVNAEVNKYEDKMLELANLGNKVDDGNC